ncbi:MAG: hypothetical protein KDD62_07850 [Bdellovibrionales bacterium]|nr:hypothetical protein [Bdellovibrionales bacterium]
MNSDIREIFEKITEYYDVPLRLSSRCEAKVYYRVEDLTSDDIDVCSEYIAERITNVCQPSLPEVLINLHGNFTGLAATLARELAPRGESLEVVSLEQIEAGNGIATRLKGANVVLVNDVITTARSCLEAHTKTTLMGASVLCWAALIDRTFGPGPVPVVASFTGAPINLLEEIP